MPANPAHLPFPQRPANDSGTASPALPTLVGPLLLSTADAAKTLAISPRTLWGLTAAGAIRAVRIGRAVRYDVRDLVAWIDRAKAK